MALALKLSNDFETWARLGKAVDDNAGLPVQFIKDTLIAAQEAKAGMLTAYQFGE